MFWFGLVGLVWFGLVWFGLIWFGLVWFVLASLGSGRVGTEEPYAGRAVIQQQLYELDQP